MPSTCKKPWGQEELLHKGRFVVKRITLETGKRTSLQYHKRKGEYIYVLQGCLTLTEDDGLATLWTGIGRLIPAKTVHRMEALEPTVYLEASTPELDDVVRIADDYGRATNE